MDIDLLNPATQQYIFQKHDDAVEYDDEEEAAEILKILRDNLPAQQASIASNGELFDTYRSIWIDCQFLRLFCIPDEDFFDVLKEHLIEGLKLEEYNIIDKIGRRLQFMDLQSDQVALVEQLIILLQKNTLLLGEKNITRDGKIILPTIQNWLQDYNSFPSKNAARSDLDEVTYINKSPNAAFLSPGDRNVLLEIIKLYDSLRNHLTAYNALPQATEETFTGKNYLLLFPGAIPENEQADTSTARETNELKPSVATPQPKLPEQPQSIPVAPKEIPLVRPNPPEPVKPVAKPMDVKPVAPQQSGADIMEQIKQNLEAKQFTAPPKPLNVQDLLNERDAEKARGGIVYDIPSQPTPKRVSEESKPVVAPVEKILPPAAAPQNLPVAEPISTQAPAPTAANREEEINKKIAALRERAKKDQE